MEKHNNSRRKLIKAAAYVAPVILTLRAAPTFAYSGSGKPEQYESYKSGKHRSHKPEKIAKKLKRKLKKQKKHNRKWAKK